MSGNSRPRTGWLLVAVLCGLAWSTATAFAQNAPTPQPQGQGQAAPGQRPAGGGMGDRFAGQPRIKALMVAGGCCHDYPTQAGMLMKALQTELPIDWNFVYTGGTAGQFVPALYNDPNWFKGYDLVVHNECFTPADSLVSDQYLSNIAAATRAGVPAVVIHCAMHTFRAEPGDLWRGLLGVHSMRHGPQHRIAMKVVAPQHPIMAGIPTDWVSPMDELYDMVRVLPGTVPLGIGVDPANGKENPIVWTHEGTGARVFGTTLGHGNDTWNDPVYQQLLKQGVRWALKR